MNRTQRNRLSRVRNRPARDRARWLSIDKHAYGAFFESPEQLGAWS